MKKHNYLSVSWSILSTVLIFSFVMIPLGVFGAVTLGTNMSTTGTFAQTVGSASAALFQNAAGTVTTLSVDTTNVRVGVGGAASTTFEVQGTASASYFFTQNTIQVAGVPGATASVAYSRFGTGTTGYSAFLSASNDVLITGDLEVDGNNFFDGKASVSGNFQTASRFIAGTASHSFGGDLLVRTNLIVGAAAASSSGGLYVAEFVGGTGTASFYFGGTNASTVGSCFQLKSTTGAWIYMRFNQGATTPTLSAIRCQ